ncbi:MAG: dienelactone hydrolase family protein [Cyanobacteriota bacterium]|nr:dienelactone hydrolase family protein [Cyanobacteriota bacterium]
MTPSPASDALSADARPAADAPPAEPVDAPESCLLAGPRQADRRLVLLHGWGADADDLLDLGEALLGPAAAAVGVVALRAPLPHPGGVGRQWYDLSLPGWPQLPRARADLLRRLRRLGEAVPLERTVLLGFSQGAAMAIDVATSNDVPLAGLIGCSGYPHPDWVPQRPGAPILLTHGREDPVVPYAAGEALEERLRERGGEVELLPFSGGHGIDPSLFPSMAAFLERAWRG